MATRNNSRSGGNRPRTHPTRSVKSTKARRPAADQQPPQTKPPRIPPRIELAIEVQRDAVTTALSLLYCLHASLLREVEPGGRSENAAVEKASDEADLTEITAMLLVRLHGIVDGLDCVNLAQADADPESVALEESVRELMADADEEDES
jgi:hypothetical protein